ncbi:class I SAM-dependent methyltransferase [Polynucleobacter sp. JS-Mosq-20-D10]|nr:class I SAM-dependent methyltransferase [Polynucleobacter sp. JS-Mosq-20-D10]
MGFGIGFWVTEFGLRGLNNLYADLTKNAIEITGKRLTENGVSANLSQQDGESLNFPDATFDHINCQGVIHHTPNPEKKLFQKYIEC